MTSRIIHSGLLPELRKAVSDLQALGELLALGLAGRLLHLDAQVDEELVDVEALQQLADRLGAHLGVEGVGAVLLARLAVLVLGEELALRAAAVLPGSMTT